MKISFFEEFPTATNLAKLKYVSFDTKLYVAAPSISEFLKLEAKILDSYPHVKEVIYWATLSIKDGYWISPWSESSALDKFFSEVLLEQKRRKKTKEKSLSVMIDFEPPKEKWQIVSRFFSFFKNREKIIQFLVDAKKVGVKLYNVEISHLPESVVWFLGLGYSAKVYGHTNIAMYYRSFLKPFLGDKLSLLRFRQKVAKFVKRKMIIAIGLIAPGIHKIEPCYSALHLEEDLNICLELGCEEAIIFRLGGMNKEMQKVCEKFV